LHRREHARVAQSGQGIHNCALCLPERSCQ
jgi:hypothetical protein